MFNLSGTELVFIAVLSLIVLGPEKLPGAMRRFGKIYREIRNISGNMQREVQKVMDAPMREVRKLVEEPSHVERPAAAAASAFTAATAAPAAPEPAESNTETNSPPITDTTTGT